MNKIGRWFGIIALSIFGANSTIGGTILQLSFVPEVQLVSDDESVTGLRMNMFCGRNDSVTGLDVGFFGLIKKDAAAIQVNVIANVVEQNAAGIQVATVNAVGNSMIGLQVGILYNTVNKFSGIGISGGVNWYTEQGEGILIGVLGNYGPVLKGMQIGLVNGASYATGVQIGVVNWAKNMRGVQVGVINYIEGSPMPVMPVINAYF